MSTQLAIDIIYGLSAASPMVFVFVFVITYYFFAHDLSSYSSKNIRNYIQL